LPPEESVSPWRDRARSRVWPGRRCEPRPVAGHRLACPARGANCPFRCRRLPAAPLL